MSVSGLTMVSRRRHLTNRDNATRVTRVGVIGAARLHLPFEVQRELLSQE
jgi:hypothetical protein